MSDPTDPDKSSSNPLFGAPAPPPPESTSVSTAPSLPADTNLPKPSSETVDPLFGASPPQDTSNSTSPAPHQPNGSTPSLPPSETVDPLFGASPPADTSNPAPTNLEDSSRDRIHSLKLARDSTLNSTAPARNPPRPLPTFLPCQTSPIPIFLHRLTSLLSLILGTSALLAGTWSIFVLPLLHASFSARKVAVEQQVDRVKGIVTRLRELRANRLYPAVTVPVDAAEHLDRAKEEKGKEAGKEEEKPLLEEIPSSRSSSSSHPADPLTERKARPNRIPRSGSGLQTDLQPIPTPSLTTLTTSLRSLSSALTSTATTRTSLLTSLESFTSHLHREIYLRSSTSLNSLPVGLGTLDANLRDSAGGSGEGKGEWDDVRKEVRAIKGLLLGRRSFALNGHGNGNGGS